MICAVAFAIAIPLLAALVLVNRQETLRHRRTSSRTVVVAKATAQGSAFVGLVAGAGVGGWSQSVATYRAHGVLPGRWTSGPCRSFWYPWLVAWRRWCVTAPRSAPARFAIAALWLSSDTARHVSESGASVDRVRGVLHESLAQYA
jgi:hypothetical protein